MGKKRTQAYPEEFRGEAVKSAEKPGDTTASVARELGVSAQKIYNWRRQFNRLSEKHFNNLDGVYYSKQESANAKILVRLSLSFKTRSGSEKVA
ncbi:transposase [Microbulbifer donghaiensis]|uniref:Transposase n=1 Tax=Microbulbifer donghaiensis TaxID=494016 RepID=A0A1M5FXR9_9GAMM|nr:transposase [Microbulbifer donghaiensis]SHF96239.1 transposase [Microbulbifer donghaiensis]